MAEIVPPEDITSSKIQKVVSDMKKVLASEKYGAALAGPQIGIPLRIFVVSGRILKRPEITRDNETDKNENEDIEEKEDTKNLPPEQVYINPTIIKSSRKRVPMDEGCLSVRGVYGYVQRYRQATVEAYDEQGVKFTRGASGLLAQVFQHEIDHLDGILFTDRAEDLWSVNEELIPNGKKIQSKTTSTKAPRKKFLHGI